MLEIRSAKKERLGVEPTEVFKPSRRPQVRPELARTKWIIVLCGPSHSGKSTFAQRFAHQFCVINSDEIRKRLTGRPAPSEREDSVWAEFADRKRRALRDGRNIILDACHLTRKARQHSLEDVDARYRKVCAVFDLPFSAIRERCVREKGMALARVRRIWRRFEKPTQRELLQHGFDEAYFISTNGTLQFLPAKRGRG